MSEQLAITSEHDTDELRSRYGMANASPAILEKIATDIDKGNGVHRGPLGETEMLLALTDGGSLDAQGLSAAEAIGYPRAGATEAVADSTDSALAVLPIAEARMAVLAGLTAGASLNGEATRMNPVKIGEESGINADYGTSAVLERTLYTPNGSATPAVVEMLTTFQNDLEGRASDAQSFVATRRSATPEEIDEYNIVRS